MSDPGSQNYIRPTHVLSGSSHAHPVPTPTSPDRFSGLHVHVSMHTEVHTPPALAASPSAVPSHPTPFCANGKVRQRAAPLRQWPSLSQGPRGPAQGRDPRGAQPVLEHAETKYPTKTSAANRRRKTGRAGRSAPCCPFHRSTEEASGLLGITQQVRGQNTENGPGCSHGREPGHSPRAQAEGRAEETCFQAPEPTPSLLSLFSQHIQPPNTCCRPPQGTLTTGAAPLGAPTHSPIDARSQPATRNDQASTPARSPGFIFTSVCFQKCMRIFQKCPHLPSHFLEPLESVGPFPLPQGPSSVPPS